MAMVQWQVRGVVWWPAKVAIGGTPPLVTTGFLSCKPPQEATLHALLGELMTGRMSAPSALMTLLPSPPVQKTTISDDC
jgi:hypothetical protein